MTDKAYTGLAYEVTLLPIDWDNGVRHDLETVIKVFCQLAEAEAYSLALADCQEAFRVLADMAGMRAVCVCVKHARYVDGMSDETQTAGESLEPPYVLLTIRSDTNNDNR